MPLFLDIVTYMCLKCRCRKTLLCEMKEKRKLMYITLTVTYLLYKLCTVHDITRQMWPRDADDGKIVFCGPLWNVLTSG